MPVSGRDPYRVLGVNPGVSDAELRSAYRHLVQRYHPDHNAGSPASARRFEEIQEAYAEIQRVRRTPARDSQWSARPRADPDMESRVADLERELREAQRAHERARQAAREAQLARERARRAAREATADEAGRPSDEELGYVTTDDSFSKILADARVAFSEFLAKAGERPRPGSSA